MALERGVLWSGINCYLGGMDDFMDTKGKSDRYKGCAKVIEQSAELILKRVGDHQRIKSIRN